MTVVGAGSATITASQAGSANYDAATDASQTLTAGKAAQTITFGAIAAKTYGDAPFALDAAASSGLAVSYVSSNTAVATVSANTVTIVGAGTATITASQAGSANYDAATDASQTLTVGKAAQSDHVRSHRCEKLVAMHHSPLMPPPAPVLCRELCVEQPRRGNRSGNTMTVIGVGSPRSPPRNQAVPTMMPPRVPPERSPSTAPHPPDNWRNRDSPCDSNKVTAPPTPVARNSRARAWPVSPTDAFQLWTFLYRRWLAYQRSGYPASTDAAGALTRGDQPSSQSPPMSAAPFPSPACSTHPTGRTRTNRL